MENRTCPQCGAPAERRRPTGPLPKYCADDCRRAAYEARCRADARYDQQRAKAKAKRTPTRHRLTCVGCKAVFTARRSDTKYCSERCRNTGNVKRCTKPGCVKPHRAKGLCSGHYNDERYPDQRRQFPDDPEAKRKRDAIRSKRRRALVRGVRADRVDRDVLGDRDGWRCGICLKHMNKTLPYPDPMSPSVDHVIPLSEGGEHTYVNTRIAHLTCNMMRGHRGGGEQLALIG